jgi:hypothetical protein
MEILEVYGLLAHAGTDHTIADAQNLSVVARLRVRWPEGSEEDIEYGINPPSAQQVAWREDLLAQAQAAYDEALSAWETAYLAGSATLEEKPVFNPPQDLSNENRVRMAVQQWLEADNEVPQFVPPTAEEQRAMMGTVTARQLRHGLLNVSLDEADVEALIAAMPDEEERKRASIDWRTANEYERLHPLMVQISAALGLTPEQIDSLWTYYQTI